jgi:hypothetical protein
VVIHREQRSAGEIQRAEDLPRSSRCDEMFRQNVDRGPSRGEWASNLKRKRLDHSVVSHWSMPRRILTVDECGCGGEFPVQNRDLTSYCCVDFNTSRELDLFKNLRRRVAQMKKEKCQLGYQSRIRITRVMSHDFSSAFRMKC